MIKALLLVGLVVLPACMGSYAKPGASQSDKDRDTTDCEVACNQAGVSRQAWMVYGNWMNRCMSGKGWSQQ